MTVSQLQQRMEELESRVLELERELETSRTREGIRRGRDQANRGEGIPASALVEALRAKYGLQRS